nr:unnamed protein product [Callosobruchus chinensis]
MNGHTCTDLHDGVRNRRKKSSSSRFFGTTGHVVHAKPVPVLEFSEPVLNALRPGYPVPNRFY